jgi:predicted AAA+ superfamily ATPase
MTHVSESLAGRLAIVPLSPFAIGELPRIPLRRLWTRGGYPDGGVLDEGRYPQWQRDYLVLLAQRDLPHWGLPARPQLTDRLFRMLAGVHGQIWNASQLGQSLGLSYHTVNSYLDYLEGAFLIRRLPAFAANVRKRLVKSPRVYWRDSGLLHALLGLDDERALLNQPWVGSSWEGFVISEILNLIAQHDRLADAYYFRTADGHELDLVLDFGSSRWAVEIKLTTSPSEDDMRRLNQVADLISADRRVLISQTTQTITGGQAISCNLPWFARRVLGRAPAHRVRRSGSS